MDDEPRWLFPLHHPDGRWAWENDDGSVDWAVALGWIAIGGHLVNFLVLAPLFALLAYFG